ncbi:nitrilase-related carbon-nitrogen hydrolase [Colwellia sp. MB02u-14]|uniref:nitrilase-related carbon-nitrogen hydrolase n=1 Tax=Colwellia sp. MB02u-14 TaxID=2759815 RepID=UPI0015F651B3|nr:nitrilase-related carbon-nitrogen hydrolase [Colwellia sp. MB02u-14]MBA6305447.1 carbon-nitrogen hydrolase [Colwellia sp. MB02u-14]
MRVAVSQFATSSNAQENLATCIRMINKVAVCQPALIVLPEYCNTLFCHTLPCYSDHNQAWHEALIIDGPFMHAIAEQAKKHNCYIVLNVTLRRSGAGDLLKAPQNAVIKRNISITSCLFSPLGELVHQEDKQTLVGRENDFFMYRSHQLGEAKTSFGKLGLLAGNDTMTFETPRKFALQGAQLLCHSMSSFAIDQSELYDRARACENKVFLAAANKVGALTSTGAIFGEGESQIVSPQGKVLAKIDHKEEGFVFADIELAKAEISASNKRRPDGTELFKQRRPELYQGLTQPMHQQVNNSAHKLPDTANIAIFATYKSNEEAIEDVCFYIENNLSDIIQLPELFFIADKKITHHAEKLIEVECLSEQLLKQISSVLRPFQYVCTSLVVEGMHQAVLISEHGLFAKQQQLHFCQRYHWTSLGDVLAIVELPLEQGNINVAMLTADDANIPEIVKVAALNNAHLLLVPFEIQEPGEVEYCLLSRAAEHRICIVAASREQSFPDELSVDSLSTDSGQYNIQNNNKGKNKTKSKKSTGLIVNLTKDFELLTSSEFGRLNGYINQPLVKYQYGKITKAIIHPITACTKH